MEIPKIIPKIIPIENLTGLPENIKLELGNLTEQNLTINFSSDSISPINFFIEKNKQTDKKIYLPDNYSIQIDIEKYNFELMIFLIDCIDSAYTIILSDKKYDKLLFGDINKWNISVCSNMMFNYPFTLDQIIYLPIGYIQDCANKNLDPIQNSGSKDLTKTLVHEKLHVGQRNNPYLWENFISEHDKNWIKIIPPNPLYNLIEKSLSEKSLLKKSNNEFISNPDTWYENIKYIYKQDNKLYYGHYIYSLISKSIKKKYFLVDLKQNKLIETNHELEQEHPYEQFAYKISEELV